MFLFFVGKNSGGGAIAVQKKKHNHINNCAKLKGYTKTDRFKKIFATFSSLKVLSNENTIHFVILRNCLVGKRPFPTLNGHCHERRINILSVLGTF
jgi:hypothetical protein